MQQAVEPAADEQAPDDAAAAFEAMRGELALLRAAVRGFAARQEDLVARDYTPDLARLLGRQDQMVDAINALARRPGLALTPEGMATRIEAAAVATRRADHEALAEAARRQAEAARRLDTMIGRVRTERQQLDALIWAWLFGAITVLVLIIFRQLGGPLTR